MALVLFELPISHHNLVKTYYCTPYLLITSWVKFIKKYVPKERPTPKAHGSPEPCIEQWAARESGWTWTRIIMTKSRLSKHCRYSSMSLSQSDSSSGKHCAIVQAAVYLHLWWRSKENQRLDYAGSSSSLSLSLPFYLASCSKHWIQIRNHNSGIFRSRKRRNEASRNSHLPSHKRHSQDYQRFCMSVSQVMGALQGRL